MLALADKYNNDSKTFEMALERLNISHENIKGSIGERVHILPAESEPSVWGTAASLLECTDLLEELS